MEPSQEYKFAPITQPTDPIDLAGLSVHQVGSLQKSNDSVQITWRCKLSADKVFKKVSETNSSVGNIAALSVKNLCKVHGVKDEEIKELLIDSISNEAYLFTAREVFKVATNRAFTSGSCKAEDYSIVFQGTKEQFVRHKAELQVALQESMKSQNHPQFIALLANPLTPFSKEEVKKYMQKMRHELGKAVVTCQEHGKKDGPSMGAFAPLSQGATTLYCIQRENFTSIAEGVRLYELRADPNNPNSPLIGYCRITKNDFHREKTLSDDEIFKEFGEFQKSKTKDVYEVSYFEVFKPYQGKSFAYILLHHALSDTLENSAEGSRIKLMDQSGFKATDLYLNVGKYSAADGSEKEDFQRTHFNIFRELYYFRAEPQATENK